MSEIAFFLPTGKPSMPSISFANLRSRTFPPKKDSISGYHIEALQSNFRETSVVRTMIKKEADRSATKKEPLTYDSKKEIFPGYPPSGSRDLFF
jgi:hypothetical protein